MSLPSTAAVSYNGWPFPTESETSFNLRMIPDVARRTVVKSILTLTVKSHIIAGATQDDSLDAIRAALERPGGQLVVTGLGLGTLEINTEGGRRDLSFGPFPQSLQWKNTGAGRAAQIVWQVEVHLLGCLDAADSGQVMEFGWEATFAVDNGGYTTRTITGDFTIPMTRSAVGDSTLPDCADSYFDRYLPPAGEGFSRAISHTVDRSKAKVSFTITDQELAGYPLPPGVVAATGSHTYSCEKAGTMVRWTSNLATTYEMARDWPRSKAWDYFRELAADRIDRLRRIGWRFFPLSLSIGEEIYGRQSAAFTLVCSMIRTRPAVGVERAAPFAGLWTVPPNANWAQHSASLANGARSGRGFAEGRVAASDDAITDLCVSTARMGGTLSARADPARPAGDDEWNQMKAALGVEDNPDPASTWLVYRCVPSVDEKCRIRVHFPLPTGPDPNAGFAPLRTPNFGGGRAPGVFDHQADPFALEPQDSPPPVVQYGGSAGYYIWIVGEALRHTYEISRPAVPPIAGVQPFDANDPKLGCHWTSGVVGETCAKIFAARWRLRYFVPRAPGAASSLLPVMPHPYQQSPTPVR
jgi:hypothetical protein